MNQQQNSSKAWPHDLISKFRTRPARSNPTKKMRQVDLAKLVGVDSRTIQQWENGDRIPSAVNLKRLIQAFLHEGHFLENDGKKEAEELWAAVKKLAEARSATNRQFPAFDSEWFETLAEVASFADGDSTASSSEYRTAGHQASDEVLPSGLESSGSAVEITATPNQSIGTRNQGAGGWQNGLPRSPAHFIGRSSTLSEIKALLTECSLVSILGSGGIGKTSFAIEAASELADKYPDGIWLFEFASVTESLLLSPFVLSVLGIQNHSGQSERETILRFISGKKALFIFDNCEHLVDEIAALADELLASESALSILATSRESLNIHGEYVFRLPPLTYPEDDGTGADTSLEELKSFEAVQFFIEKAHITSPRFQPDLQHLKLIGDICRRLEGIPLAIELAVARMNILTLEQIQERLANLLTFLTSGKRNAAPRQQTLKSAIDWSYDLLTEKEQLLLRRLSVFSGVFTLEAAEAISSCTRGSSEHLEIIERNELLDLLSSLVNKSLINIRASEDGYSMRYYLLESIREYGNEKLREEAEPQSSQILFERHARYYNTLLVQAEKKFRTSERDACLRETRQEYANLSVALRWACQQTENKAIGLHIASNLYWFWLHEGRLKEGSLWLRRVLDGCSGRQHNEAAAKALHGQGVVHFVSGHTEDALDSAARSITISRELELPSQLASSLRLMAFIHIHRGQLEEAEPFVQESVEISRGTGEQWNLAGSLHAYGKLKIAQEQYQEAISLLQESVFIFESIQDKWELSGPYESLGYSALKLGQTQQCLDYFKKSVAISQIYSGTWVLSRGIEGLAIALCSKQAYAETAILLGAAEKCREAFGGSDAPYYPVEHAKTLQLVRANLGEQEIDALWAKAKAFSKDRIVAFALEV
ncbi:tetratricopeptide repeat protein [Paenibacillus sp. CAU 1782]